MNDEWITLHAGSFHIGTEIQVTGGRIWGVAEISDDPERITREIELVFMSGGEIRDSIRTRRNDVEIWTM